MLESTKGIQPWDDLRQHNAVLRTALKQERRPLATVTAPACPGAYLFFLASSDGPTREIYGPLADGRDAIYAGSTVDLGDRTGRHDTNLDGLEDLSTEEIHVLLLPSDSHAAALYMESALTERLRPLWNEPSLAGAGSRAQGGTRVDGQRVSSFDALHPGRAWARSPRPESRARARLAVASYLLQPGRRKALWPALITGTAVRNAG